MIDSENITAIGCIFLVLLLLGVIALEGWIMMLLWNWIAPVFWVAAPQLNFWLSIGIIFLLNIVGGALFKSTPSTKE